MRDRTIKQHYVPEFYLRNFSKKKNGIYAQSVHSNKRKIVPISGVAQGKKYYDVEISPKDLTEQGKDLFSQEDGYVSEDKDMLVFSLEKWFKIYEDRAAPIIKKIIK